MSREEVLAKFYARLLSARISDQVTVKEYYAQAEAYGRKSGTAKNDLMRVRQELMPVKPIATLSAETIKRIKKEALSKYRLFIRNCESENIPVEISFDRYYQELLEVAQVEANEPKLEPVGPIGPSYNYTQYQSPRNPNF